MQAKEARRRTAEQAARCACVLLLVASRLADVPVLTAGGVRRAALGAAFCCALALSSAALGAARSADPSRVTLPGGGTLSVREHDLAALQRLGSALAIALATAWLAHAAGLSTNWLLLQCGLLPLSAVTHDAVRANALSQ